MLEKKEDNKRKNILKNGKRFLLIIKKMKMIKK